MSISNPFVTGSSGINRTLRDLEEFERFENQLIACALSGTAAFYATIQTAVFSLLASLCSLVEAFQAILDQGIFIDFFWVGHGVVTLFLRSTRVWK